MKSKTSWIYLYNCLYIASSNYTEIKYLESPIFEVLDELETMIEASLRKDTLDFFEKNQWIDRKLREELEKFYDYVDNIAAKHWNIKDFDEHEDWNLTREWAKSLMKKLGMEKNGWDSTGEKTIYLK
jgi:hypothetical protein